MRIKHVMAGVTIAAGALLLSACDWGVKEQFSDVESLSQPVTEVRFANDSGDVKITVGDAFQVQRTVGYRDTKPGKTYRMDGGALVLEACPERDCWVDYEIMVPEGTKVSGHVDSGNVEVVGVASANVAAESGDVTVRDVAGEVNATAQSGSIDLSGIGGAVVTSAESGDVTVALTDANNVTASAQSGNVQVTVPKGDYQVDIQSENENVRNEVGGGSTGPKIDLRAESGDISLLAA
jgi:major membrane immunogen (membrane-anchored lipoprotein)